MTLPTDPVDTGPPEALPPPPPRTRPRPPVGARVLRGMGRGARRGWRHLDVVFGGPARRRVIVLLACVLALSSADAATVGASATELRQALHIGNTDIGLLVAVNSVVAAVFSVPFGILTDKVRRTWTLGLAILLWGAEMIWSATVSSFGELVLARLFLGAATAAAGPTVASMIGDWFTSAERGRIYSYILTGELLGAGLGFAVTGDIAALSWRAAFIILALPTFVLAIAILRLPEPARGGTAPLLPGAVRIPKLRRRDRRRGATEATPHPPVEETDAQRVAREHGVVADEDLVLRRDPRKMGIISAARYVLKVRTNVILIVASACGYFYLAGMSTFGAEFAREQFNINQAFANGLMLVLGIGAVAGVLTGGQVGDGLLRRRYLNSRMLVAAVAATATALLFIPALHTRSVATAMPYLMFAAFFLSAQNPALDAARLDIMPPLLWGRAEGVRTLMRTAAQALAPILFGFLADHVFGGGRGGLQWSFTVMLVPLLASGLILFRGLRTYPRDVATAGASATIEVAELEHDRR